MQQTIANKAVIKGIGIHSGDQCEVLLEPASSNSGVLFYLSNKRMEIPVSVNADIDTVRSTSIRRNGSRVQTIEHLLASIFAYGIDNIRITVSSEELPILDGSAKNWIEIIERSGLQEQFEPGVPFYVKKQIKIRDGDRFIEACPSDDLEVHYIVDFPGTPIGRQEYQFLFSLQGFIEQIAPARTCGFLEEVETLYRRRLGLGGNLENCVVVKKDRYITPLRFPDEVVRHKILDFIGDLRILSSKVYGKFVVFKGSHSLHFKLVKELAKQIEVAR